MIATKKPSAREAFTELLHSLEPEIEGFFFTKRDAKAFIMAVGLAVAKRPQLYSATRESLTASILTAAKLQLHPVSSFGYFAVEKSHEHGSEAIFVPGWYGFVELLRRFAGLKDAEAHVVCERDTFRHRKGSRERFDFEAFRGPDRGPVQAVFVEATFNTETGSYASASVRREVLYRHGDLDPVTPDGEVEMDSARGKSRHDYAEWAKTVAIKRLAKWYARTPDIAAAIDLERASEKSKVTPRAVDVAAALGIETSALGASEAAGSGGSSSGASGLPSLPIVTPAASPCLRCCDCGNNDKVVVAHKIERLLTGELSIKCVEHESDSAHTHRICPGCIDTQKNLAAELAKANRKNKRNKSLPLSPSGSGVGMPAPEPPPTISEAMGVEPGSSSIAPDELKAPLGGAGSPPVSEGSGSSSEPSLTSAPEASSEGTAKASEGVQDHPRESLSEVSAETIQAPRVEEPAAAGEAARVLGGSSPSPSSPAAEVVKRVPREPWSRIAPLEVEAVTQDAMLSREFAHLVNTGEDTPVSSDLVARVQRRACVTRGKKAVDSAHETAGGVHIEDPEGVRNKERERGPLTALQARVFWRALVQPRYTP